MELTEEYLRNKKYRLCVIDADLIAYKSSAGVEKTIYELYDGEGNLIEEFKKAKDCKEYIEDAQGFLEEDTEGWYRESRLEIGTLEQAKKACDNFIKSIKKAVKAKEYRCYLTGDNNFRHDIASIWAYKGNRSDVPKPKYLEEIRQYLVDEYNARVIHNIECDDAIAVALYNSFLKCGQDTDVLLASVDKDLMTVVGNHYDFDKDVFVNVSEIEADRWLGIQALAGDRVDNIQGLPNVSKEFREKYQLKNYKGVGVTTAEALLNDCETLDEIYQRVLEAYRDYYGDSHSYTTWDGLEVVKSYQEIADENFALVYMMRKKDEIWYDYKQRIKLDG